MKHLNTWFFPLIATLIFISLLGVMLYGMDMPDLDRLLSFSLGLLAFSVSVTVVLISLRPKRIERKMGLPNMYAVHGWMALVLTLAAVIHATIEFDGFSGLANFSLTSWAGLLGVSGFVLATLTGVFMLSNNFIAKSRTLMRYKEKVFKREIGLWLHRISILAVLGVYTHMISLGFLNRNRLFVGLATFYTIISVGGYVLKKLSIAFLPKYTLRAVEKPTPTLYELDLTPEKGSVMDYRPGDYVFLRFKDADVPAESHPFSLSSAPIAANSSLQVMVKQSGDFTRMLDRLKAGDRATLEGPYGNFFPKETELAPTPMVLLAGGIGLTPILSIIRSQMLAQPNRKMTLVWALAFKEDLMLLDEFDQMKQDNPNFSYEIIFSDEEVDGYPFGFVTADYLTTIGMEASYSEADFFICGPPPMMRAGKQILLSNGVAEDKIHLEEFGF